MIMMNLIIPYFLKSDLNIVICCDFTHKSGVEMPEDKKKKIIN